MRKHSMAPVDCIEWPPVSVRTPHAGLQQPRGWSVVLLANGRERPFVRFGLCNVLRSADMKRGSIDGDALGEFLKPFLTNRVATVVEQLRLLTA